MLQQQATSNWYRAKCETTLAVKEGCSGAPLLSKTRNGVVIGMVQGFSAESEAFVVPSQIIFRFLETEDVTFEKDRGFASLAKPCVLRDFEIPDVEKKLISCDREPQENTFTRFVVRPIKEGNVKAALAIIIGMEDDEPGLLETRLRHYSIAAYRNSAKIHGTKDAFVYLDTTRFSYADSKSEFTAIFSALSKRLSEWNLETDDHQTAVRFDADMMGSPLVLRVEASPALFAGTQAGVWADIVSKLVKNELLHPILIFFVVKTDRRDVLAIEAQQKVSNIPYFVVLPPLGNISFEEHLAAWAYEAYSDSEANPMLPGKIVEFIEEKRQGVDAFSLRQLHDWLTGKS
jgi:hypothetical protein